MNQRTTFDSAVPDNSKIANSTIGTVVDTNDPQQMGRLRILCPQWGDSWSTPVEDLPWALYVSPFGGTVEMGTRGPGIDSSEGAVAYGMWAIPKLGAQALVMCVDGNPATRVYAGCVYDQFTPHTMPHGRYMQENHPALSDTTGATAPFGPYTSYEKPIEPLATNQRKAFGLSSKEFATRAADYSVSAVKVDQLSATYSKVPDDEEVTTADGMTITQGYSPSRIDPHSDTSVTNTNTDSLTYSIVTPGFHSFSMDDRQENCRIRWRTTSGNQIILDDTNERIYISTAEGNCWVEMDVCGNIDMFSTRKVSIHSADDLNLTSDKTIRLTAADGIHLKSKTIAMESTGGDITLKSSSGILAVGESVGVKASTINILASSVLKASGGELHLKATNDAFINGASVNVLASTAIKQTAPSISTNGAPASPATSAEDTTSPSSYPTSRIPQHEPWARVVTASDDTQEPELGYDDPNVGKMERGVPISRGRYWRR